MNIGPMFVQISKFCFGQFNYTKLAENDIKRFLELENDIIFLKFLQETDP